jgi:hypothetical protein
LMKAIKGGGEVKQGGVGVSWWEKSIVFMSRVREQASRGVKKTWQKLVDSRRGKNETKGPELGM